MGLLDDAIREHLDLKRRRGGDPAEIARSEQEALGPVRREPGPDQIADEHHDEHAHDDAPAPEVAHAHDRLHEDVHAAHEVDEHVAHDEHGHHKHDVDADHAHAASDDATHTHEPAAPAPAPESHPEPAAAPAPDPRHSDIVHQPTTEFHVEHHHDDDDEPPASPAHADAPAHTEAPDDDVLEETPDFLQETPEHDRLWFEQRPPRDFDFDG
jgi:hypothetical protein